MQGRPFVIHLLFSFSVLLGREEGGHLLLTRTFTGKLFLCLLPHSAKNSKQVFIGNMNVQSKRTQLFLYSFMVEKAQESMRFGVMS